MKLTLELREVKNKKPQLLRNFFLTSTHFYGKIGRDFKKVSKSWTPNERTNPKT